MKYYLRPLAKIALTLLLGFLESIPYAATTVLVLQIIYEIYFFLD